MCGARARPPKSITANASGTYTVTVTNGNGCSATSTGTTVTVNAGGTALPGTACNDGLATTGNDTWNSNCQCVGLN
jgi:hypothetical protein